MIIDFICNIRLRFKNELDSSICNEQHVNNQYTRFSVQFIKKEKNKYIKKLNFFSNIVPHEITKN